MLHPSIHPSTLWFCLQFASSRNLNTVQHIKLLFFFVMESTKTHDLHRNKAVKTLFYCFIGLKKSPVPN